MESTLNEKQKADLNVTIAERDYAAAKKLRSARESELTKARDSFQLAKNYESEALASYTTALRARINLESDGASG